MSRDIDEVLLAALERADLKGVSEALDAGADPNAHRDAHTFALDLALAADMAALNATVPRGSSAELIELLLDNGADRTRLANSLCWAVQLGRADLVRSFMADPTEKDRAQLLAVFCRAADRGSEDVLDALFESGLRPTEAPTSSPVVEALERGQDGVFRRFLEHRLWLDAKYLGRTPVHSASAAGNLEALQALIKAGAEIDLACSFRLRQEYLGGSRFVSSTPLHVAVRCGNFAIVEALLAARADSGPRDGTGRTALDWAEEAGAGDLSEALRRLGVRRKPVPKELRLVSAAEKGNAAALEAALASEAAVDTRDSRMATRGMTPLMLAARGDHVTALQILLAAGASVDLHDDPKKTSHGARMAFDSDEASEVLRDYGVCPKRTALHYAAEQGCGEAIDLLLAAGAAPSAKDFRNLAPLHLAVLAGHLEAVRRLLAGKARVTVTDLDQQTPLHFAAKAGDEPIARELLAAGAKPERPDEDRETPLRLAESAGHRRMIELLRHPPPRAKR